MLDKSYYNGMIDYELEIEAPSQHEGLAALQAVLTTYKIKKRLAKPKIERFFRTTP